MVFRVCKRFWVVFVVGGGVSWWFEVEIGGLLVLKLVS